MPVDHFSFPVPQDGFEDFISFLKTSLSHLGFKEIVRPIPTVVGLGEGAPYFWLNAIDSKEPQARQHVAFTAKSAEEVKTFHAAALKAGATCNGPPGPRDHYHPGYYAAFVIHPASNVNVEVVCHNVAGGQ